MATFTSAASQDDGYATTNDEEFSSGSPSLYCGDSFSGYDYFTFLRIPLPTVPQGAVINAAKLTLFSQVTDSPFGSYQLVALAEDDSAQISGSFDLLFRATTLASKTIDSPSLVADSPFDIEGIEALVQEVVNRPGFAGVIQFKLSGFSQPSLTFHSFDSGFPEGMTPVLTLDWEAPSAGEYTGTIAVQTAAATVAITGIRTTPAFTSSISVATAAATVSIAGTFTPPAYTGSVAVVSAPAEGAIAGMYTPPAYTGGIAAAAAAVAVSILGIYTERVIVAAHFELLDGGDGALLELQGGEPSFPFVDGGDEATGEDWQ